MCPLLATDINIFSEKYDLSNNICLKNQSDFDMSMIAYIETKYVTTVHGYLIATKANCFEQTLYSSILPSSTISDVLFKPINFTEAIMCSDGISDPSESRELEFTEARVQRIVHRLPGSLLENTVEKWTDYNVRNGLETNLAS